MMSWPEPFAPQRADLAALEEEMARETATTPKELVYARGTLRLYRYLPQTPDIYRVPVLIVMSIVSKPYIFDLTAGQSFVEHLVRAGFEVYLIDWGMPRAEHRGVTIDDYVADLLPDCIAEVRATSGVDDVTVIHPGFIRTPMTANQKKKLPFLLEVDDAACRIIRAVERRARTYAFPWQLASLVRVIKHMPGRLYDRLASNSNFRE